MYAISIPNLVEIRKVNLNSLLISPGMTRMFHYVCMYVALCVILSMKKFIIQIYLVLTCNRALSRSYIILCIYIPLLTLCLMLDQKEEGSPSLARKVQVKRRRLKSQTMVKQSHSRTFLLQGKLNVSLLSGIIW